MKRLLSITIAIMFLTSGCAFAYGGSHFESHSRYPEHYEHHEHYRYHNGGWWIGGALAGVLAVGVILENLPPQHKVVYVHGVRYIYDGQYYYQEGPEGYVVVEPVREIEIPRDFVPVLYRGTKYYFHNNKWFVISVNGEFVEVPNPIN